MAARITLAGESLIARKLGTQQSLDVVRFIFANVPGLDHTAPVDRAETKPPAAQIVHVYTIPENNIGYVNPNQVVYSSMLASDIGDFDWNWMGLETAENQLLAIAYVPLQQKRRNIPPIQVGNNVTRNILVEFDGAQALTGVTIDASTWQHDFTVRLKGIDERERMSNRDIYGRACFFDSALQVEKVDGMYQVKPGIAYVEGVRVVAGAATVIAPSNLPTTAWIDVALERQLNDVAARWTVVFGAEKADYVDTAGCQHYCVPLAELSAASIIDRRSVEPIKGSLIQHLAARDGDYAKLRARATTKDDVDLGNLPNAISDDDTSDSSEILASTKAVNVVRRLLQSAIDKLLEGTTPAGKAKQWATARKLSISGAGTGSVSVDGSADATLALTLADSGVTAGTYTKLTVNGKGIVTGGGSLSAADIPALDFSKITTGTPTTLEGYGITDAIPTGLTNKRPQLYAPEAGAGFTDGALEIREAKLVNKSQRDFVYAPRMAFHWGGITSGDLAMSVDGFLCWNGHPVWHGGNFNPDSKAGVATTLAGYGITDGLAKGQYGLGGTAAPLSSIDSVGLPGGFHYFGEGPTSFANYVSLVNIPYGSGAYAAQLGFQQGLVEPRVLVRSVKNENGGWTPTRELYHTGNLDPDSIVPPGSIVAMTIGSAPKGYLKANGAAVSRTSYARLFNFIGTYYGAGDGSTTFNLPDLRGVFVRGWDDARGLDPNRALGTFQQGQNAWHVHTAAAAANGVHYHPGTVSSVDGVHAHTGSTTSNGNHTHAFNYINTPTSADQPGIGAAVHHTAVGNVAGNRIQNAGDHIHWLNIDAAGAHGHSITVSNDGSHTHAITVDASGGTEARPMNIAMLYCIKY
ncbi:phage tail-collar fiber domain-containing protein [Pseudomonas sp. PAB10]|uniref:phage tail-collar fiber domain-containing protein n=1 Tax=Pseudomonas sp. PAB10 TaxID=3233047 RepID=UPI003F955715